MIDVMYIDEQTLHYIIFLKCKIINYINDISLINKLILTEDNNKMLNNNICTITFIS